MANSDWPEGGGLVNTRRLAACCGSVYPSIYPVANSYFWKWKHEHY